MPVSVNKGCSLSVNYIHLCEHLEPGNQQILQTGYKMTLMNIEIKISPSNSEVFMWII